MNLKVNQRVISNQSFWKSVSGSLQHKRDIPLSKIPNFLLEYRINTEFASLLFIEESFEQA